MSDAVMVTCNNLMAASARTLTIMNNGRTVFTITPDGKIELGDGLSMEEATQLAAQALAKQYQRQTDPT